MLMTWKMRNRRTQVGEGPRITVMGAIHNRVSLQVLKGNRCYTRV
jgi:hypothetical protein